MVGEWDLGVMANMVHLSPGFPHIFMQSLFHSLYKHRAERLCVWRKAESEEAVLKSFMRLTDYCATDTSSRQSKADKLHSHIFVPFAWFAFDNNKRSHAMAVIDLNPACQIWWATGGQWRLSGLLCRLWRHVGIYVKWFVFLYIIHTMLEGVCIHLCWKPDCFIASFSGYAVWLYMIVFLLFASPYLNLLRWTSHSEINLLCQPVCFYEVFRGAATHTHNQTHTHPFPDGNAFLSSAYAMLASGCSFPTSPSHWLWFILKMDAWCGL